MRGRPGLSMATAAVSSACAQHTFRLCPTVSVGSLHISATMTRCILCSQLICQIDFPRQARALLSRLHPKGPVPAKHAQCTNTRCLRARRCWRTIQIIVGLVHLHVPEPGWCCRRTRARRPTRPAGSAGDRCGSRWRGQCRRAADVVLCTCKQHATIPIHSYRFCRKPQRSI
jgi:hypothetical protein